MAEQKKNEETSYWEESLLSKDIPESKTPKVLVNSPQLLTKPPTEGPLPTMELPQKEIKPPPPQETKFSVITTPKKRLLNKKLLLVAILICFLGGGVFFGWLSIARRQPDKIPQSSPLGTQKQETFAPLLPERVSSAFIPLPPSRTPSDSTLNWQVFRSAPPAFSFKYPKEWKVKNLEAQDAFIRLSYPTIGETINSFSGNERMFIIASLIQKEGSDLEAQISKKYSFGKKEKTEISGVSAVRVYNVLGGANIFLFIPYDQRIIVVEHHVRVAEELPLFEEVFLLIDKSIQIIR